MAKTPQNLWLRYRTWFLRLSIPPSLRHHFGGKDKIVESLRTSDLNVALAERDRRTVEYHARFERLRTGAPTDADITDLQRRTYEAQKTRPRRPYRATFEIDDAALDPAVVERLINHMIEQHASDDLAAAEKLLGVPFDPATRRKIGIAILDAKARAGGAGMVFDPSTPLSTVHAAPAPVANGGERFSEAFAAHARELERADTRATTIKSYTQMAGVFQAWGKDAPIASIKRAMASDFLVEIGAKRSNATVNQYAALLAAVFETARRRGRFTGDNGFKDQKRRTEVQSYEAFTGAKLTKLFASATFEIKPKTHTVMSALPWVALIAAYSGMRREEVCQLRVQDLREIDGVWAFDVNEAAGPLKNKGAARVVPLHSTLLRAGLLKYLANLPEGGRLFPGLRPRASRGGKLGPALGDAFEKWRKSVGVVRDSLTFHSFRHAVSEALDRAGVAESDASRILGHQIAGMSYGVQRRSGIGASARRGREDRVPGGEAALTLRPCNHNLTPL
jgi:integrase